MRSFLIVWLLAFGLIAGGASAVSWYVEKSTPPPTPVVRRQEISFESDPSTSGPFSEAEAVEIISRRLPTSDAGDQLRRELLGSATVTYHSAQHWRVCYDNACWVAHGPGRYAEPENDAARQRETVPSMPR
jgi:hypothetical protein